MRCDQIGAVGVGLESSACRMAGILRLDARLDVDAAQARPAGHERVVLAEDGEVRARGGSRSARRPAICM